MDGKERFKDCELELLRIVLEKTGQGLDVEIRRCPDDSIRVIELQKRQVYNSNGGQKGVR